jgi:hypothetical protein
LVEFLMMMVDHMLIDDHLIHWLPPVPFLELYIHQYVSKCFMIKKKSKKKKYFHTFLGGSEQSVSSVIDSLPTECVP